MPFITNPVFNAIEKTYLEFMLHYDFPKRIEVIAQLNNMKEADITRDVTPYYWIMEFRPKGINPGYGAMRPLIGVEILHENGIAPTAFTLHERNGVVFELEIYNADSSAMDLDTVMDGQVCIHLKE